MRNLSSFIKRHPIVAYFVLAYGLAWSTIFVVAALKGFRADKFQITDIILIFLAMLIGPSLASITLTAVVEGKTGLQSMASRMGRWRVGLQWYLLVLLFPVLILSVLLILSIIVSPVFAPGFVPIGLAFGLAAGFFEEIGWTGFALPRLQLKYTPLIAGGILGLLWGFWHILGDYFGNIVGMGDLWLPYFLFGFVAAMTATRILITWVYNRTESILLAQLMHASSTGFLYVFGISATSPFGPSGYAISFIVYAATLWILVGLLVIRSGKQLQREAIDYHPDQRDRSSISVLK